MAHHEPQDAVGDDGESNNNEGVPPQRNVVSFVHNEIDVDTRRIGSHQRADYECANDGDQSAEAYMLLGF